MGRYKKQDCCYYQDTGCDRAKMLGYKGKCLKNRKGVCPYRNEGFCLEDLSPAQFNKLLREHKAEKERKRILESGGVLKEEVVPSRWKRSAIPERNKKILELRAAGMSTREIAIQFGLAMITVRTVK